MSLHKLLSYSHTLIAYLHGKVIGVDTFLSV